MTQKEVLETLLQEIKQIKTQMPNGELKQMQKDLEEIKEDMSDMKYTLLNPEQGVIVNSNKNTEYRQELQANEKEFRDKLTEIDDLQRFKDGVTKALWIIFTAIAAIILRMLFVHSDKF